MQRASLLVVALAALGWLAPPAVAQPKVSPKYKELFDEGQEAYLLGKFDQARELYERAKKLQPELPGAWRRLAAVAEKQGRYDDCLEEAVGYLKRAGAGSAWTEKVRNMHARCRDGLRRPPFSGEYEQGGAIAVTATSGGVDVEGATVRLNGLKYGATPMPPRAVALGEVEVSLEADRYLDKTVKVDIIEGIVLDVNIELEVDPDAPPDPGLVTRRDDVEVGWITFAVDAPGASIAVEGEPVAGGPDSRIERAPGVYEVEITAEGREPWRRRVRVLRGQRRTVSVHLRGANERARYRKYGYIALGVATAATGAGVVFSALEHDAREEAQDIHDLELRRPRPSECIECNDIIPPRSRDELQDAVDRADRYRIGTYASFGVAAAALGASIYFFIKERPAEREGFELPMAVAPIGDGAGGIAGVGASYTVEVDW